MLQGIPIGRKLRIDLKKARHRAEILNRMELGIGDAAHLAFAELAADVYITCDDRLMKKSDLSNISMLNKDAFLNKVFGEKLN